MLRINLAEELTKISRDARKDLTQQTVIIETNRLLEYGAAQDRAILRAMGLDKNIKKLEEVRGLKVELDILDNKYKQIFTTSEIKTLAVKYMLKFAKTDRYAGTVDPVCLQKIKEFGKEAEIEFTEAHYQHKFFILAPQSMFKLDTRPVPPKPRRRDPLLFYKIDDGHYRLIHKWGNDLSIYRRWLGFRRATSTSYMLCNTVIVAIVLLLTTMLFLGTEWLGWQIASSLFIGSIIALAMLPVSGLKDWADVYDSDFKD